MSYGYNNCCTFFGSSQRGSPLPGFGSFADISCSKVALMEELGVKRIKWTICFLRLSNEFLTVLCVV